MKTSSLLAIVTMILVGFGCVSNPDFSSIPKIEYIGLTKNSMVQNNLNTDSLYIQISFEDNEGDFGNEELIRQNLFIVDSRTNKPYGDEIVIPQFPEESEGRGVSGTITFLIYTTCCLFEDPNIPPCESPQGEPDNQFTLDVSIADRAGNLSNEVTTDPITLVCD